MDFVRGVAGCEEYAELFSRENIDGAVLALLTDSHLQVDKTIISTTSALLSPSPSPGPGYEAGPGTETKGRPCQEAGQLPPLQALQALPRSRREVIEDCKVSDDSNSINCSH